MKQVCFLTEQSTILLKDDFPGQERIYFLRPQIWLREAHVPTQIALEKMPRSGSPRQLPEARFPDSATIQATIGDLINRYDEIIVLLPTKKFSFGWESLREAVDRSNFRPRIHWVDSQSFAAGVGILCQTGAQAAAAGLSLSEILELLRLTIPYIYTLMGVCSFSYLHRLGLVDAAQTLVGELMKIQPVWLLENGRLIPVQKVRSNKNFTDLFLNFLQEVGDIELIGLIQGNGCFDKGAGMLADRIKRQFSNNIFIQKSLHPSTGAVIGPASISLFILESNPRRG
jgi:DegV family protein with EDD domain